MFFFFFFNDTATTEIYTLSLHDALPISWFALLQWIAEFHRSASQNSSGLMQHRKRDRKSTRLNSSHSQISYAVFCLKKKKKQKEQSRRTQPSNPYKRASCTNARAISRVH